MDNLRVELERAFLMNSFLAVLQRVLPRSALESQLCAWLEESLTKLHNRFHLWVFLAISRALWDQSDAECREIRQFFNETLIGLL